MPSLRRILQRPNGGYENSTALFVAEWSYNSDQVMNRIVRPSKPLSSLCNSAEMYLNVYKKKGKTQTEAGDEITEAKKGEDGSADLTA